MIRFKHLHEQPWLTVSVPVAGLVGLAINRNVEGTTDQALRYDIEIEDEGDDLRVAVLDLRHHHRNLVYIGYSRGGLDSFDASYRAMVEEITEFEQIGVIDPRVPTPGRLSQLVEVYYTDVRRAIATYYRTRPDPARAPLEDTSPARQTFLRANDEGLSRLSELENLAEGLDELGEERAETALTSIDRANQSASRVLFAVLAGLVLVGAGFAYSVVRTVNEFRRLYARQQATSEELARALQAKTDFIADASHELRTPITIVRGNAEVGLALDRDGVQAEVLAEIVKGAERMTRLVEDLLFLARSDSASLPLKLELLAADTLGREIVESAEFLARQHAAQLETELRGAGQVLADKTRIEQAILILIDNAAKYGGGTGTITLTCATEGDRLRIAVSDRGSGIPAGELPKVFERFYRVDKARARKQGGAGLGLAIAKTIAEAHHGTIEAHSRLGHGTTVAILLPLAATSALCAYVADCNGDRPHQGRGQRVPEPGTRPEQVQPHGGEIVALSARGVR